MIKKILPFLFGGLALFALNAILPRFLQLPVWYNPLMHFLGGGLVGLASLALLELSLSRFPSSTGLILPFSIGAGFVSMEVGFQFFQYFQNYEAELGLHPDFYHELIENLEKGSFIGLILSLMFFLLLRGQKISFLRQRLFACYYMVTGAVIWGVNWELYEAWYYEYTVLDSWTSWTLYQDTIYDLFMDLLGGAAAVLTIAFKKSRG